MKGPSEYTRLTETGAPHDLELAAAIRAVRGERASPREISALAERLAPQLAAPPLAPAAWSGFTASKWLVSVVFAFSLSLLATLHFGRSEPQAAAPSAAHSVLPQPIAFVEPPPLPAAIEPSVEVVVPARPSPRAPRAARPKPQKALAAPQPEAAASSVNAEAELQLLGRAQRALDPEPRAALALAEEHAAAYPRGLFVQEREMLAIQALLKLQQRRAALGRAKAFLSQYPTSPHARHLRPLLETGE